MRTVIAILALVLLAAACGGDDDAQQDAEAGQATTIPEELPAPETTAAPVTTVAPATTAAPAGETVTIASTGLGDVLVDGGGLTLYLFVPDDQGPSVCYDECATAWPPLVGEVIAGEGVDASLLGAVARDDGTQQATYNGWPLYYFAGDAVAGETNGQGLNDVWYVLSADGDGIGIAAMAQALAVSASALGDVLVDGEGRTLYLFVPDAQGASTCYDGCAAAWPPMVEEVVAGDGVDESLLGSVARDDGTEQVTYNGWPLYYFASDANPGDVNGQGVNDVWFVLSASGDAISS